MMKKLESLLLIKILFLILLFLSDCKIIFGFKKLYEGLEIVSYMLRCLFIWNLDGFMYIVIFY